jgi:Aldehyde dehydrogenase family
VKIAAQSGMKLFIGGMWVSTERKVCLRSPYDGSTIERTAWGGKSNEQASRLANATRCRLRGGITSTNLNAALQAAGQLEFGGATINESPSYCADQTPYRGVKTSENACARRKQVMDGLAQWRLVAIRLSGV